MIYIYGFLSHGLPPNHPNGPFQTLNPWWHGDPPCRSCPGQALADQRKPLEAADDTIFQLEVRGEKSPPPRSFPTSVEIVYSILYYMIYIYILIWYDMTWYDMIWKWEPQTTQKRLSSGSTAWKEYPAHGCSGCELGTGSWLLTVFPMAFWLQNVQNIIFPSRISTKVS